MNQTADSENSSFLGHVKTVVEDGINYAISRLQLFQAELASMALSSVIFVAFILIASLSAIAAFVLLTVALGIWLAHALGGAGWALLIIGGVYALIAIGLGGYAFRWLTNLKS